MYFIYDDVLYLCDGVILYKYRVVALVNLQSCVLHKLHSAHQEVKSMLSRGQQIVFGITREIEAIGVKFQSQFTFSTVSATGSIRSSYTPF